MFNELTKMFGRKERRHSERKKGRWPMAWLNGTEQVPGTVMEMSLNGCLCAIKAEVKAPTIDVFVDFEGRKMRMRLDIARSQTMMRDGAPMQVIGAKYSGIAADDYDALVRFHKGQSDPENKSATELAAKDKTDDAYRLLPLVLQQRVLQTLANAGRLEMPPEGQQPLLRMEDLGPLPGGRPGRRLAVHSRIATHDGPKMYDSVITVDPTGRVTIDR